MIVGVGTDIVESARVAQACQNPRFLSRCFTDAEQTYLQESGNYAGHFAAKEAVVKALGTGFSGFWPVAVEITHDDKGRPVVRLHGKAADLAHAAAITRWDISISHCQTHAVAMAIAQSV